jgi:protein phosphatase methylesterase 1
MSFAAFASQMKTDSIVYAFDHRGHGTHTCENETELSQENLISDTLRVMEFVRVRHPNQSLTLCGHSMGGSIAVKTARRLETTLKDTPLAKALSAIVIIDVVEGTAMEALPFMESVV